MAKISAAMVKQLREMTDAPMMECKKALVEADSDLEKAVDVLRTMGIAKAVKRAGRDTNEGTIASYLLSLVRRSIFGSWATVPLCNRPGPTSANTTKRKVHIKM